MGVIRTAYYVHVRWGDEIRSIWFTVYLFVCTVTNFSAGALPRPVRQHLRSSPIAGAALAMAEFWASTVAIWRDMLLAEALVFCCYLTNSTMRINHDTRSPPIDCGVKTVSCCVSTTSAQTGIMYVSTVSSKAHRLISVSYRLSV